MGLGVQPISIEMTKILVFSHMQRTSAFRHLFAKLGHSSRLILPEAAREALRHVYIEPKVILAGRTHSSARIVRSDELIALVLRGGEAKIGRLEKISAASLSPSET